MPLVEDITKQFEKNLESSTHIYIAAAWVTSGSAMDQLEEAVKEYDISLRIIVGTHGNATEPEALERLNDIGELRLVPNGGPLFHPKMYIFKGKTESKAWVGSANFTRAGFERNVETVFETKQCKSVLKWFQNQWRKCGALPVNAIEEYRKRRSCKPPTQPLRSIIGESMRDRIEYLDQAQDWPGYVDALTQCNNWWKDSWIDYPSKDKPFTVYGNTCSWTHTIEQVMPIVNMENWDELGKPTARKLLGTYHDDYLISGLLGTMRGNGKAMKKFLYDNKDNIEIRRDIQESVRSVITAHDVQFPYVAVQAIKEISEHPNISIGIATRFLSLARPDMIVSMNGGSKDRLKKLFPDVKKIDKPDGYGQLLDQLYHEPWFRTAEPSNEFEKKLWSMRAALIDCFVYSIKGRNNI